MTNRKRILFVIGRSPGRGAINREVIDAVLVIAAFDQDVGVLFTGDGVLQLLRSTRTSEDALDHAKALDALAMYDVTRIYVDAASLAARGLTSTGLALSPELLDSGEVATLIATHDAVIPG